MKITPEQCRELAGMYDTFGIARRIEMHHSCGCAAGILCDNRTDQEIRMHKPDMGVYFAGIRKICSVLGILKEVEALKKKEGMGMTRTAATVISKYLPEGVWGNPYSMIMFSGGVAYNPASWQKDRKVFASDLARHWRSVADRLEALNKTRKGKADG